MNQKLERHAWAMRNNLTQAGRAALHIIQHAAEDFAVPPVAIQNTADKRAQVVLARHHCFGELAQSGVHPQQIARMMGGMDRSTVYKALRKVKAKAGAQA